jgi:uncharacterized coiled-coil protein SlyX
MDLPNFATWASLVGAVVGSQALVTVVDRWFSRRNASKKTDAEVTVSVAGVMLQWQTTLTQRIIALESAIAEKDTTINILKGRVSALEAELETLRHQQDQETDDIRVMKNYLSNKE